MHENGTSESLLQQRQLGLSYHIISYDDDDDDDDEAESPTMKPEIQVVLTAVDYCFIKFISLRFKRRQQEQNRDITMDRRCKK